MKIQSLLLIMAISLSLQAANAQTDSYAYLLECFVPEEENGVYEFEELGEITTYARASEQIEGGLMYYAIPVDKKKLSQKKIIEIASERHINTWKNNSKILSKKIFDDGGVTFADVRLHLLIEDIYIQVVIAYERDTVYEIIAFSDSSDPIFFDSLTELVKKKQCP
jgi:hypothetical protein